MAVVVAEPESQTLAIVNPYLELEAALEAPYPLAELAIDAAIFDQAVEVTHETWFAMNICRIQQFMRCLATSILSELIWLDSPIVLDSKVLMLGYVIIYQASLVRLLSIS